jgi:hypothetical protein
MMADATRPKPPVLFIVAWLGSTIVPHWLWSHRTPSDRTGLGPTIRAPLIDKP